MDVKVVWDPIQGAIGVFDFAVQNGDLVSGRELDNAIMMSLFTNRRAGNDDVLPNPDGSKMGWWGDTYADNEGDQIGSRLWLLYREKQTQQTLNRAKQYVQEALEWLIEDRIAQQIQVSVEYDSTRTGVMLIGIVVYRNTGTETYRFDYLWQQLESGIATDANLIFNEPTKVLANEAEEAFYTESNQPIITESF